MARTIINDLYALIPEWVVEEHKLNNKAEKVGNAYILNPKDLTSVEGAFFEHKVTLLGGMVISSNTAKRMIKGTLKPILFEVPKEDNPVSKENLTTEIETENEVLDNESVEETLTVDKELEE